MGLFDGVGKALGGVGNFVGDALGMGPGGKTKNVNKASDYDFYDAGGRFGQTYDQFSNEANFMKQGMGQFANQVGNVGAQNVQGNYDPNAFMNQFNANQGGLVNAVQGANSPLQQSLNAIAQRQAAEGVNAQAQNFGNMGALNSGAAMAAMGEAASSPFAQAQAQLQQNQLQGSLGLMNNAMGQYGQAQQFGADLGLRGQMANQQAGLQAGMANQQANLGLANLYGGLYGQNMAGMGQLGSQSGTIVAPHYQYEPSAGERFRGAVGDWANIGANAKKTFG